jgi:hypothetical protein
MRPTSCCLAVLALFLGTFPASAQTDNKPPKGFTALFNGKTLEGWYGWDTKDPRTLWKMSEEERAKYKEKSREDIRKHWRVENGELVNDGYGLYATTDKDYGDIELLVDYKTVPKADSGIYLRAVPQVQIWDYTKEGGKWNIGADKGSGGLWNNRPGSPGKDPLVLADKPFGHWNHFRILQVGARTTVYLNDKLVVDHAILENYFDPKRVMPLFPRGPIQLQTHGGEIRWRNLFVRGIPADEANAIQNKKNDEGFTSVFDGKTFEGWTGAVNNYEVHEGAIRCKAGKGGFVFTKEEFDDFVIRLEIKLPPGGNNGLAIRYPGKGDPAYTGMCECQVLDSTHPKYAKIDPRQHHGSAYGMVAAYQGHLRSTGQWNVEEVTVKASTIKVELNGSVILDADLSKVDKFLGNTPHPGKDLKKGHFGFCGHSDPVEFRNIRIKRLSSAAKPGEK